MSKVDMFFVMCFMALVTNSLYDTLILKPRYIESNRILSDVLIRNTESRDINTKMYELLESSMQDTILLIKGEYNE